MKNNSLTKKIRRIIVSIYTMLIIVILETLSLFTKNLNDKSKNILIVKLDAIGDYVLFRNFIEIIKKDRKFKNYKLTYVGNQSVRSISEWLDGRFIDRYIWIDYKKIIRNPLYLHKIISSIKNHYEFAIQPTYSRTLTGDYLIKRSTAKYKIGFLGDCNNILSAVKNVSDHWYSSLIKIDDTTIFEFDKNKKLFEHIINKKIPLQSPQIKKNELQNIGIQNNFKNINGYIVIFPGASMNYKMWSIENYAKIVKYISEKYNVSIVICGSKREIVLANKIINITKNKNVFDLTGKTNLRELTHVLANAKLLITNDTSAAHIGPAVDINVIALSQMSHYGRFLPYPAHYPNSNKVICIIPNKFSELSNHYLQEKFKNGSDADINLINYEEVKKNVNLLLDIYN